MKIIMDEFSHGSHEKKNLFLVFLSLVSQKYNFFIYSSTKCVIQLNELAM